LMTMSNHRALSHQQPPNLRWPAAAPMLICAGLGALMVTVVMSRSPAGEAVIHPCVEDAFLAASKVTWRPHVAVVRLNEGQLAAASLSPNQSRWQRGARLPKSSTARVL
jgi:hypothetical protein